MVNVNECNIATELDFRDFNSEISEIHFAMVPSKAFSAGLGITKPSFLLLIVTKTIVASCP